MDKKIQKELLKIIEQNRGCIEWRKLSQKINQVYFSQKKFKKQQIPSSEFIVHNLDLLEENNKVSKIEQLPFIYYKILTWGHYQLKPWHKKWSYFLIHRKHNLVAVVALIVSVLAFILSIIAMSKDLIEMISFN
jgi:hypothetical protein